MDSTLSNYYGWFYLSAGRSSFYTKGCVIFCIANFKLRNSTYVTREFYCTNISVPPHCPRNIHSEAVALSEVEKIEKAEHCRAVSVQLYSSFSPCGKCCQMIRRFLDHRPQCTLYIAFTCLYRSSEDINRFGLQALNKHHNVRLLDVFTDKEWRLLEDRGCFMLSPITWAKMNEWDAYWRKKLIDIVTA